MKPTLSGDRSRFEALSVTRWYRSALGQPVAWSQSSQKLDNLCCRTFFPTAKRDLADLDLDRVGTIAHAQFKCHLIVISILSGNLLIHSASDPFAFLRRGRWLYFCLYTNELCGVDLPELMEHSHLI